MDITIKNHYSGEGATYLTEALKEHFKGRPVVVDDCAKKYEKKVIEHLKQQEHRVYIKVTPAIGGKIKRTRKTIDVGDYSFNLKKDFCVAAKNEYLFHNYSDDPVVITLLKEVRKLKDLLIKEITDDSKH